jgi:hypothetical protein
MVVVVSADCDLHWDYLRRRGKGGTLQKELRQVLVCEVLDEATLEAAHFQGMDSKDRRKLLQRIRKYQEPRYHYLSGAHVGRGQNATFQEELFVDFKLAFTVPTAEYYFQSRRSFVKRRALLVPPHVHHLTQRCYNFLGRIGVDE